MKVKFTTKSVIVEVETESNENVHIEDIVDNIAGLIKLNALDDIDIQVRAIEADREINSELPVKSNE